MYTYIHIYACLYVRPTLYYAVLRGDQTSEQLAKAIAEYNPFKARRDPNYLKVATGGLDLWEEGDGEDKEVLEEVRTVPYSTVV
jgi:hypothetical protein